jgi:hypothetical protein
MAPAAANGDSRIRNFNPSLVVNGRGQWGKEKRSRMSSAGGARGLVGRLVCTCTR